MRKGINTYKPAPHEVLELEAFKKMDNAAVTAGLPIGIMMEQAGFQLARLVAGLLAKNGKVIAGIGPGNNGGGGLVAARRLKAWGVDVGLHLAKQKGNEHFTTQLKRCRNFSIPLNPDWSADIFIDAYLGFSQRLPLDNDFSIIIKNVNAMSAKIISLDLPTGYGDNNRINPEIIVCLAAAKKPLTEYLNTSKIFIADLGIPFSVYKDFGFQSPIPFSGEGIVKWI